MSEQLHDETLEPREDENVEVAELDDKEIEDVSGGVYQDPSADFNWNCNC